MTDILFSQPFWIIFNSILGLIMGSFISCMAYRLPNNINLWKPSFCPKTNQPLKWHQNLPILGYILAKGRCQNNPAEKISPMYPIIEITTTLTFILNATWLHPYHTITANLLFIPLAILTTTDITHKLIPPKTVGFTIFIILAVSFFNINPQFHIPQNTIQILTNALTATGIMTAIAIIGEHMFKKQALGFGDILLGALFGTLTTPTQLLEIIYVAAIITAITIPFHKKKELEINTIGLNNLYVDIMLKIQNPNPDKLTTLLEINELSEKIHDMYKDPKQIPFGPGLIMAFYLQFILLPNQNLYEILFI